MTCPTGHLDQGAGEDPISGTESDLFKIHGALADTHTSGEHPGKPRKNPLVRKHNDTWPDALLPRVFTSQKDMMTP
jgi:hypothetical protein